MMAEKPKYFWLKLKEDFFDDDVISWIEEQENGKEYCLFYLKMCLKSLKHNGVLRRAIGEMLIPYTPEKIAEITRTSLDTVMVSLELFKRCGLVEVLDDGSLYMNQLQNMVGSSSASREAVKKRAQRDRLKSEETKKAIERDKSGDKMSLDTVTNCPTEIRDKRLEIRDKSIDNNYHHNNSTALPNNIEFYNRNIQPITRYVAEEILELEKTYGEAAVGEAMAITAEKPINKKAIGYVKGVLKKMAAGTDVAENEPFDPFA